MLFLVILALHALINIAGSHLVAPLQQRSRSAGTSPGVAVILARPRSSCPTTTRASTSSSPSASTTPGFGDGMFWFYVLPLGFLLTQYTITGFDASRAHLRGDPRRRDGAAKGVWRSVFYSARRSAGSCCWRSPSPRPTSKQVNAAAGGSHRRSSRRALSSAWVKVVADHLDGRPAVLRHGLPDQRLAHVLRVQPRRRGPRLADLEPRQRAAASRSTRSSSWPCCAGIITSPPRFRATPTASRSRSSRSSRSRVIGLYIAYVIPIYLRWRMGDAFEPGPWTLGSKYKWMNPFATVWVGLITIIFILPFTPAGVPWQRRVRLEGRQLRAARDRRRDPRRRHLVAASAPATRSRARGTRSPSSTPSSARARRRRRRAAGGRARLATSPRRPAASATGRRRRWHDDHALREWRP